MINHNIKVMIETYYKWHKKRNYLLISFMILNYNQQESNYNKKLSVQRLLSS